MTCESCGGEDSGLTAVHRMYITSAAWDQAADVRVLDDVERWCVACLTQYPHRPVDA